MTVDWWTLGFQTVNVAILVWLLGHFFWKPVASIIDERRKVSEQMLADADAKQREAAKALEGIQSTRAGFAKERETILTAAQEVARKTEASILEKAESEADAIREAGESAVAAERMKAEQAWQENASKLAVEIARKLLTRVAGAQVQSAFVDALSKSLQDLPEATKRSVDTTGQNLKAISAKPLGVAEKKRLNALVKKVFGVDADLQFETDESLIAGVELRGKHLDIRNSWRADLEIVLGEIRNAPSR